MQITVNIRKDKVVRSLSNIGTAIPNLGKRLLLKFMRAAMDNARRYPAPISRRYKRTGTYFRSFKIMPSGSGAGYTIHTDARQKGRQYSVYVGGDAMGQRQARVHAGRWMLVKDAVDEQAQNLVVEYQNGIGDIIRQEGMGL